MTARPHRLNWRACQLLEAWSIAISQVSARLTQLSRPVSCTPRDCSKNYTIKIFVILDRENCVFVKRFVTRGDRSGWINRKSGDMWRVRNLVESIGSSQWNLWLSTTCNFSWPKVLLTWTFLVISTRFLVRSYFIRYSFNSVKRFFFPCVFKSLQWNYCNFFYVLFMSHNRWIVKFTISFFLHFSSISHDIYIKCYKKYLKNSHVPSTIFSPCIFFLHRTSLHVLISFRAMILSVNAI